MPVPLHTLCLHGSPTTAKIRHFETPWWCPRYPGSLPVPRSTLHLGPPPWPKFGLGKHGGARGPLVAIQCHLTITPNLQHTDKRTSKELNALTRATRWLLTSINSCAGASIAGRLLGAHPRPTRPPCPASPSPGPLMQILLLLRSKRRHRWSASLHGPLLAPAAR